MPGLLLLLLMMPMTPAVPLLPPRAGRPPLPARGLPPQLPAGLPPVTAPHQQLLQLAAWQRHASQTQLTPHPPLTALWLPLSLRPLLLRQQPRLLLVLLVLQPLTSPALHPRWPAAVPQGVRVHLPRSSLWTGLRQPYPTLHQEEAVRGACSAKVWTEKLR